MSVREGALAGTAGAPAAPAGGGRDPAWPAPEQDLTVAELKAALAGARERIAQLEALAHVDELTGVLNRRGFQRELARARSYVERYDVPVALVLVDLDRFKPINDTHGHAAGDAVLHGVAQLLQANLRASDVVARIGGDEFALLLWHSDAVAATRALIKLQQRLAAARIEHAGLSFPVEASLGLAPITRDRSLEDIVAEADRALYAAKAYRRGPEPHAGETSDALKR